MKLDLFAHFTQIVFLAVERYHTRVAEFGEDGPRDAKVRKPPKSTPKLLHRTFDRTNKTSLGVVQRTFKDDCGPGRSSGFRENENLA